MANFDIAYKITMSHEGGYVNNPNDRGGETYCGIARKFHPDWDGWNIIDKVKSTYKIKINEIIENNHLKKLVKSFYKQKFWDVNNLDLIENQEIANELFDTGVNMFTATAAKFLQESLNILNRDQKDFNDIKVDGNIGPVTIKLTNNYPSKDSLLKALNGFQFMKYYEIVKRSPSQEEFMRGWLKRT